MARKEKKEYTWLSAGRDFLIFFILLSLLFRFVLGISRVEGSSMADTLHDGQIVFSLRLVPEYHRGDVVAARMPNGEMFVKRIVGAPGDRIELKEGTVFVNGQPEAGSYVKGSTFPSEDRIRFPYTVEEDSYFLMGDNREHSQDSRYFGAIRRDELRGRLFVK